MEGGSAIVDTTWARVWCVRSTTGANHLWLLALVVLFGVVWGHTLKSLKRKVAQPNLNPSDFRRRLRIQEMESLRGRICFPTCFRAVLN